MRNDEKITTDDEKKNFNFGDFFVRPQNRIFPQKKRRFTFLKIQIFNFFVKNLHHFNEVPPVSECSRSME